MAQPLRVDLDQRTGIALDRVARMDVGRSVPSQDLPVRTARKNATVQLRPRNGAAEQVDDATMPERGRAKVENVGNFAVHTKNRFGLEHFRPRQVGRGMIVRPFAVE